MEDKIIGPLTLKQFLYLLGGGMVDYLIFSTWPNSYIGYFVIFLISLIFLAFAFVRVQEQEFSYIIFSIFSYLFSAKKRSWNKNAEIEKNVIIKNASKEIKEEPVKIKDPNMVKSRLETLSEVVDTHGWGKKQYEEKSLEGVRENDFKSRVKSATEAIKNINLRARIEKKKNAESDKKKEPTPPPQGSNSKI